MRYRLRMDIIHTQSSVEGRERPVAETVKVSMNLPRDEVESVAKIADEKGITKTDVVRRGLAAEKFIEELPDNAKLLVELPDGTIQRVVFPW